ncbi:flagellar hook-associated protein 2 [Conyzicola lurida]|uniref:Flagellar hook-associated protein 2 n=1 Tax=Conyzicola lurida TaxID=1172621 RepID=A0A841AU50_9MICO|nr:flagellar filament capping protein FliD [Conyzicola lurida]MBB5845153.1 flagellar hook-associated protein 2 [Conyzicola lurida]
MATLGLDGLASGLPTTELIASLMALETIPQTLLKNKVTSATTEVTALQGLNALVAALQTLSATTAKPAALDFYNATSTSTKVTATATTGAVGGEIDIVVGALAQSQSGVTAPMTAWTDPPVITIVGADGVATEITADSNSLDDVVAAINGSAAGVSATKVASGTDAGGAVQYRLQLTGKASGAENAFTVYAGTEADVTAGTATNVLAQAGAATVRTAQDASVTLWKGTAAEQVITSTTNTFTDLLPGVSVTVSGVSADPVTVAVSRDNATSATTVKALVTSLNEALAYIKTRSSVTTSTDATGAAIVSGGVFTGDSTVRDVSSKLLAAASQPVNGKSPSEYGISITKTGTMEFDEAKFTAAFAKDPAGVQAAITEIAGRLADAAKGLSDKTVGTITSKITGTQTTIDNLSDQVERWDDRLATRKANLQRMYSAFEVRMSNMNAQMTWLTSQVDALQAQKD